jgi:hypothetical protein
MTPVMTRSLTVLPVTRARSGCNPRAIVRLCEIDRRSLRDESGRVQLEDRVVIDHVITGLRGGGYPRHRIQLAHVIRETGIVRDALLVALEDREIGDIEAHEHGVEPPHGAK